MDNLTHSLIGAALGQAGLRASSVKSESFGIPFWIEV